MIANNANGKRGSSLIKKNGYEIDLHRSVFNKDD